MCNDFFSDFGVVICLSSLVPGSSPCRPLLVCPIGDSEIGTIYKIFQKLGTPTEKQWRGLSELPDFSTSFPQWPPKPWSQIRNLSEQLESEGLVLLQGLLEYDPAKRPSARGALRFEYLARAKIALATDTAMPVCYVRILPWC